MSDLLDRSFLPSAIRLSGLDNQHAKVKDHIVPQNINWMWSDSCIPYVVKCVVHHHFFEVAVGKSSAGGHVTNSLVIPQIF